MPRFSSEKLTITLPETSFEMYNCEKPSLDVEVSKEELLDMYTKMTTMRRMEMTADGLYKAKKIRGFCHLCNGQVSYHFLLFIFLLVYCYDLMVGVMLIFLHNFGLQRANAGDDG